MISTESYVKQIAVRCNRIAGEASDVDGFVSVRRLVDRFGANLLIRRLLVEGMLASSEEIPDQANGTRQHRWCLLIDRETHDVEDSEISAECFGSPLSSRLRNTVAHELVHSLAFRAKEFGVEFPKQFGPQKSKQEFLEVIERDTEKLSPLLLLPDALLDRLFAFEKESVSMPDLCATLRNAGVSRYVFINRVKLLELVDPNRLLSRPCLSNVAVGIGQWSSETEAALKVWPLFSNFDGGSVPGFLFQLMRRIPVSARSLLTDPGFRLCGGDSETAEMTVPAGTPANPDYVKLPIRFTVEKVPRKRGAEFLFLVQSRQVKYGVD